MELKIYNPSEDGFLKNIEWNFDELKQEIKQAVEPYKGLVLTDEQIPEGKSTVTNLRKFVAAFETERKRIKKQCMEPYEKFKQQYDELLVDVNDAIKAVSYTHLFENSRGPAGEIKGYSSLFFSVDGRNDSGISCRGRCKRGFGTEPS